MKKLLLAGLLCLEAVAQEVRAVLRTAIADFQAHRIPESVRGFDQVAKLRPDIAPELWQRGIALYYAGRYQECRGQFESHRTVNPNDVENAAWHFLCVAGETSAAEARRRLLPVGADDRVPMRQIYGLFAGEISPEAVLRAAGSDGTALFYAHLYVGLWSEAMGNRAESRKQMRFASDAKYAPLGGYMHDVARVHLALRNQNSSAK